MAVKGSATVTLSQYRDTESVTRYYKLQSSSLAAPDKPTNVKPNETPAGWAKAEPACDITKTLYTCDVTVFSDKTTHVSDVSKSTSYEAAKEAWNKANNAQGTADKAQNTATEAAKTADNYISADSTGIMVSENKGATKETPSTATKSNVLITEEDVQIRNGQKVLTKIAKDGTYTMNETGEIVCRYTSKGIKIGLNTGKNIEISDGTVSIRDGAVETMRIESTKTTESLKTEVFNWDGSNADAIIQSEKVYTKTFTLERTPSEIYAVEAYLPAMDAGGPGIEFGKNSIVDYSVSGKNVTINIDGRDGYARSLEWQKSEAVIIYYIPLADAVSRVSCNNLSVSGTIYTKKVGDKVPPIVDMIYPIGSIYMSVKETSPAQLFGGIWYRIKDTFLLSAGNTYAAGTSGGSAKATLPSHTHTVGSGGYQLWGAKSGKGSTEPGNQISGDAKYYAAALGGSTSNYKWLGSVDSKGVSDVSQANMPPYLAVYVWQRIS